MDEAYGRARAGAGPTLLATYLGVQNPVMILLVVLGSVGAVLILTIGLYLNQG